MNNTKFVRALQLEIESRKSILFLDEENIQEFLNILFPLIESMRNVLRDNIELTTNTNTGLILFKETINLINTFLDFENKWNYSYSTWHTSFKNNRKNIPEYLNSDSHKFYDIQTYYKKYDDILNDMHSIKRKIIKYNRNFKRT
jgi:hypothetical protein